MLYTQTESAHVVMLPYGNKRFTAVIALPKEEGEGPLGKTVEGLFAKDEWSKVCVCLRKRALFCVWSECVRRYARVFNISWHLERFVDLIRDFLQMPRRNEDHMPK